MIVDFSYQQSFDMRSTSATNQNNKNKEVKLKNFEPREQH